jgi:hypothetical protein
MLKSTFCHTTDGDSAGQQELMLLTDTLEECSVSSTSSAFTKNNVLSHNFTVNWYTGLLVISLYILMLRSMRE